MIKLDNVSKYYYSANAVVPALKKIQLEFNIGEFVAITGESGSGKTTLLNVISGLDSYEDGELYYNGKPTSHFGTEDWEEYQKNKIGFVFANNSLIDTYTALQNVESSLLIQGISAHKAKETALDLLKKVGMSNFASQKTAKLSSGQRQRLAIARALAKNTDIIVADEPTANLDVATGKQIVELLSELSKNKLILLVTHNYEEVEPYITRKIRIQDGQVVQDVPVRQDMLIQEQEESEKKAKADESEKISERTSKKQKKIVKSARSIARRFAGMNLTTDSKKSFLLFTFLIFSAIVSFAFIGIIYTNKDDINTKEYDTSVFYHKDINRIAVRHTDGSSITTDDMNFFKSIEHVKTADRYDYVNDINYYSEFQKDYKYVSSIEYAAVGQQIQYNMATFLNKNHFMKSTTCLSEDDLSAGSIPTELFEIVVYSDDPSVIGTTKECYFTAENIWGNDAYYYAKCTITGILKKDSDQIYFSPKLSKMLSVGLTHNEYVAQYNLTGSPENQKYRGTVTVLPVMGEGLSYNQMRVTAEQFMSTQLNLIGPAGFNVNAYDEYGATFKTTHYNMEIVSDYNEKSSISFYELSEEFFNELFPNDSTQAGLFIDDYVNMDKVLTALHNQGYEAISTYRTSAVRYVPEKVSERMSLLSICVVILIILCVFEVLTVRSFLRIKSRNFEVLKSMGMNYKTAKKITYYELPVYALAASIFILCVAIIDCSIGNGFIKNLMKYFTVDAYIIYFAYNIFVTIMTAFAFNRYLHRNMKWSSAYDKN